MLNYLKSFWLLGTATALIATGCGDTGDVMSSTEDPQIETLEPLATPVVRLVSPPVWSAGDVVTVLGSDFVAPDRGVTYVTFNGRFRAETGVTSDISMTVLTTFRNAGRVEFVFEPALPPSGFGQELGTFAGEVTAENSDDASTSPTSRPVNSSVEVGPSLIIWSAQPEDRSCRSTPRISTTLDGTKIVIDLEAIGLTEATAYTPITLRAAYVSLVVESLGELPQENVPMEVVTRLTTGRRAQMTLDFGRLPNGVVESAVQVSLTAEDGLGKTLSRLMTINIGREYSISYDGNIEVVELYAPVQVSACLPGGPYGANFSYSEGTSESRSRSIGYSVNLGLSLWIANVGFGFNVGAGVSSGESDNLGINGRVLPNQFGVFYRQTQRLLRIGQIEELDVCGAKRVAGEARVTDWNWAPDLAITTNGTCPPAPASNLPPAQVFE